MESACCWWPSVFIGQILSEAKIFLAPGLVCPPLLPLQEKLRHFKEKGGWGARRR